MEFLAESIGIGLLNLDVGVEGGVDETVAVSKSETPSVAVDRVVSTSLSFSLFPWIDGIGGQGASEIFAGEDAEGNSSERRSAKRGSQKNEDRDGAEINKAQSEKVGDEEELGESSQPFLSTLTPASPLTLASSSLDFLVTTDRAQRERCNRQDFHCGNKGGRHGLAVALATNPTAPLAAAQGGVDRAVTVILPGELTNHVIQRIDARTGQDCFTGRVDAITGHLVHGTMLYRKTGEVYNGPFVSQYIGEVGEDTAATAAGCDVRSLRHGHNATCQYSNGMVFEGSFEYDRPKTGAWTGDMGWTYEGSLIAVTEEQGHSYGEEQQSGGINRCQTFGAAAATASCGSISSSGSGGSGCVVGGNVIGIPHLLPGLVLFHGNGRFTRLSDGLAYRGEFLKGLADGVGRETLPNGRGVYCGEFRDGLRHGVGTLVECDENDEDSADGVGCLHRDDAEDCIDGDWCEDHGPDFAAGGAMSPAAGEFRLLITSAQRRTCPRRKRHRYSSGVWCAGRFEIEDCRGTVRPGSSEFAEEKAPGSDECDNVDKECLGNNAVLNRTTWDMLDEKWLGLGV